MSDLGVPIVPSDMDWPDAVAARTCRSLELGLAAVPRNLERTSARVVLAHPELSGKNRIESRKGNMRRAGNLNSFGDD